MDMKGFDDTVDFSDSDSGDDNFGGGDDWGFGQDEPASSDDDLNQEPSPRHGPSSTHTNVGTCTECSKSQSLGEIDPEGGLFYCHDCWTQLDVGKDDFVLRQTKARVFPDPTEQQLVTIKSISVVEGRQLIIAMYDSVDAYELDEQLGLIEDEARAEMLTQGCHDDLSPERQYSAAGRRTTFIPEEYKVKRYRSELDSVLEAGLLEKRGGGTRKLGSTRYKKRWFELVRSQTGIKLTYQVEAGNGTLKRAVNLGACRLQNDTRNMFSLHEVAKVGAPNNKKRVYHLRATSIAEKLCWLRALHPAVMEVKPLQTLVKQPLPVVSGYMTMQIVSGIKTDKAKQRWIEIWSTYHKLGPTMVIHDSAIDDASHTVDISEAAVINDNSEKRNIFSILVEGTEYRCNLPNVSKEKWLQPLVAQSKMGILMQQNSPSQTSPLKLNMDDDKDEGLDIEC
eukprot:m.133708 g.133708  ORF g.133708 m.133708 type:complete len:451 (+) comp29691_c1_seq1:228-1580(+)